MVSTSPAKSQRKSEQRSYDAASPEQVHVVVCTTANTMASAIEALGMSLPYSSSIPAEDPLKIGECIASGKAILNLLEKDIKPREHMTREAFENAMVMVLATGGSTNAVLHLIAMARSVSVPLTIDDFQRVK